MYSAFQSNNDDETTEKFSINASGMREMVDIAALNSRVKFDRTDVPFDQRAILGDATESGLTRFAGRNLETDYDSHIKNHPKAFEVPFNSTNKWALVIVSLQVVSLTHVLMYDLQLNKEHSSGGLTAFIKGAPERVLAKCTSYLEDGKAVPMTDKFKGEYDEAYDVSSLLQKQSFPNTIHTFSTWLREATVSLPVLSTSFQETNIPTTTLSPRRMISTRQAAIASLVSFLSRILPSTAFVRLLELSASQASKS